MLLVGSAGRIAVIARIYQQLVAMRLGISGVRPSVWATQHVLPSQLPCLEYQQSDEYSDEQHNGNVHPAKPTFLSYELGMPRLTC